MDRKLTAILYADVAGYSRLTGADDEGTVETLKLHLGAMKKAIEDHGGRIVNTAGDAVLADFASVVTALKCAVEAQRGLAERNKDLPDLRKLQFRVGVNLGDIVVDGEEIYGDGINVAARLESLADPGGICISGRVQEQVEDKLDVGFAYLGAQSVKNIKKPVNVYKVLLGAKDAGKVIGAPKPRTSGWGRVTAAVLAVIVALGGWTTWLHLSKPEITPAARNELTIPLSKGPSIAVLPFDNMSGDPDQAYFADGMTDDLITRLSQISGLFVIARNSTFTYKDKPVKVQDVASDLGVRYVMEGSVRRAGGTIRINAQLIDATTGGHLWAQKFDRDYKEIFALQDEITELIAGALSVELTGDEQARLTRPPTDNLEAYETFLKAGLPIAYSAKAIRRKLSLFKKATELDPNFAEAHAADAALAAFVYRTRWWGAIDPTPNKGRERALDGVTRALALNPDSPLAHSTLGILELVEGRHDEALRAARKAVSLAPNSASLRINLATVLAFSGQHDEAAKEMEAVLRLDPKPSPSVHITYGFFHLIAGKYDQARERLSMAKAILPNNVVVNTLLGGAYARLGMEEEAKAAIELALKGHPNRAVSWRRLIYPYMKRREDLDRFADSLRMAGLPEWPLGFEGAESDRLTGAEIKELLWGRQIEGTQEQKQGVLAFKSFTGSDGSWKLENQNGEFTGTARVDGDMFCLREEELFFGQEQCVPIYRNPGGTPENKNEYVTPRAYSLTYFSVVR